MSIANIDPRIISGFNNANQFKLQPHLIAAITVGSQSHGTWTPKDNPDSIDDIDIMLIVQPPPNQALGLYHWEHWVYKHEELDVVAYSLNKFVSLLTKQNPNVLGVLWTKPEFVLYKTQTWDILTDYRDSFSSRQSYESFVGYAAGQIHRMEHFDAESRNEMKLIEDELTARGVDPKKIGNGEAFAPAFSVVHDIKNIPTDRLKAYYCYYRSKYTSGYMGDKRRKLVEKFGYDCKNASHAIRLMRMCVEFLATGELKVYRDEDAADLIAIKKGEWALEQVKTVADELFAQAKNMRQMSPLEEKLDERKINELLVDLTLRSWGMI